MDGIVKKKHIYLNWRMGATLDKEIAEKNKYIVSLQKDIEQMAALSSANKALENEKVYHQEIIQKQLTIIENLILSRKGKRTVAPFT